jgi:flagellar basal-body rod protein FlgB
MQYDADTPDPLTPDLGFLMLPNLFTSTNIPALGEVLNFAQARHGVLVGNLANINTPGYHVRDLSVDTFQQKLKEAMSQSRSQSQPLSPGISQSEPGDPMRQVRETLTNVLYHDDTNIDLEKQTAEITKNQFLHNFALTVMTDQMSLLQNAISERV